MPMTNDKSKSTQSEAEETTRVDRKLLLDPIMNGQPSQVSQQSQVSPMERQDEIEPITKIMKAK